MASEISFVSKASITLWTLVWLDIVVHVHVVTEVLILTKAFSTNSAHKLMSVQMNAVCVSYQFRVGGKCCSAKFTLQNLWSSRVTCTFSVKESRYLWEWAPWLSGVTCIIGCWFWQSAIAPVTLWPWKYTGAPMSHLARQALMSNLTRHSINVPPTQQYSMSNLTKKKASCPTRWNKAWMSHLTQLVSWYFESSQPLGSYHYQDWIWHSK